MADREYFIGNNDDIGTFVDPHSVSYVQNWLNIWSPMFQASQRHVIKNAANMHWQITFYFKKQNSSATVLSKADEITHPKKFNTQHAGCA
eukprot:11195962-Ditylum_brightwellii.AAC.1